MSSTFTRVIGIPVLLATVVVGTSGCGLQLTKVRMYGECTNRIGGGGECKSGAEAVWEPRDNKLRIFAISAVQAMGILPDAGAYELDTAGSTIPYPATGTFVVTLTDTSTGQVQAAASFPWVKVGTILKAQNPTAINDWAYANAGTADKVSYEIVPFRSNYGGGQQIIAGQAKYEGSTQSTFSVAFDGGSACNNRDPVTHLCRN